MAADQTAAVSRRLLRLRRARGAPPAEQAARRGTRAAARQARQTHQGGRHRAALRRLAQPVGRAARPAPGSGTTVVIPNGYYGGFYPWGWAGLGFGGYYGGYYGYYDPWIDGGGYGGYYGQPYTTSGYDDGMLRLKMKPREGVVYVDGFFAGRVDDFDGVFQRLHIEPGAHHIEITADGYEPLELDVQIQRGRLITYSGDKRP